MKSFVVLAFGIKMPSFAPRRGGNVFAPTLYMPQVLQYYRVARKMTHTRGQVWKVIFSTTGRALQCKQTPRGASTEIFPRPPFVVLRAPP